MSKFVIVFECPGFDNVFMKKNPNGPYWSWSRNSLLDNATTFPTWTDAANELHRAKQVLPNAFGPTAKVWVHEIHDVPVATTSPSSVQKAIDDLVKKATNKVAVAAEAHARATAYLNALKVAQDAIRVAEGRDK